MTQIFLRKHRKGWEAFILGSPVHGYGCTWKEAIGDFAMLNGHRLKFQFVEKGAKGSAGTADKEV